MDIIPNETLRGENPCSVVVAVPFKWQQDRFLGNPHETFPVESWEGISGMTASASAGECYGPEAPELTLLSAEVFCVPTN